jgi:hypothetical protein
MRPLTSEDWQKIKKQGDCSPHFFATNLLRHFHTFVVTAAWANAVCQFVFAAIIAFDHAWNFKLEMRTAHSFPGFGSSPLRYCHLPYTSFDRQMLGCSIGVDSKAQKLTPSFKNEARHLQTAPHLENHVITGCP